MVFTNFCFLEDAVEEMKTSHRQGGSKYLQVTYLKRDLYPEYITNTQNFIFRKQHKMDKIFE